MLRQAASTHRLASMVVAYSQQAHQDQDPEVGEGVGVVVLGV